MPELLAFAHSFWFRAALAASVFLSFGIYHRLNSRRERMDVLTTRLDEKIPFLPAFSIPYILYLPYLFLVVGYGILKSPYYAQIAASALAVQLAAAAVYRLNQTHVPRPTLAGKDPFSRLTAYIYSYDRPYCTFPSLHVAYSLLCAYWSFFLFPGMAPFFAVFTAAVAASTLFLKQHAVADVFAGAALAVLSLAVVG